MENPIAKQAFDALSRDYFEYVDQKPHNAMYERPAMLELLNSIPLKNKVVLDAGCAAGWYSEELLKRQAVVTGIDVSEEMIQYAKKRTRNLATHLVWNLEKPLDFLESNSQDLILSSLTLHYIENWDNLFKEFNRILKPGGHVVFSVQHPMQDYKVSKHGIYYELEPVEYTWRGMHYVKEVTVPYYRRPLSDMINSFLKGGFELQEVVEPQPLETLKQLNPSAYETLHKQPAFICFKLKKRAGY